MLLSVLMLLATTHADVITLDEALHEALQSNMAILESQTQVDAAHGETITASLIPNPTLLFLSSLQPFPGHRFTQQQPGGPQQYDVSLLWPIDWLIFGKRWAQGDAAKAQLDATTAQHRDVIRQRLSSTIAAFFAVLEAKALAQISDEFARNLQQVADLTQKKLSLGGASAVDADYATLAAHVAQREAREAKATLMVAKSHLRALLGRPSPAPQFDVQGTLEIEETLGVPELNHAIERAYQHRPDIEALRQQVIAARYRLRANKRDALPTLSVQGGFSYQDQRDIGFNNYFSWSLGLALELPVFDHHQGQIMQHQAALRQAEHRLHAATVTLQAEVEQALALYQLAERSAHHDLPKQLTLIRSVRDRMRNAYDRGGQTLVAVLDAEREMLKTMRQHTAAMVEHGRAYYRLQGVLGEQNIK